MGTENNVQQSPLPLRRRRTQPTKYTPPKSSPPRREKVVVVDKPSGVCPKCESFVKGGRDDDGVLCVTCNAYWHLDCAEVTYEALESTWKNIDYICSRHNDNVVIHHESPITKSGGEIVLHNKIDENNMPADDCDATKVLMLRVAPYTLNDATVIKQKIKLLECEYDVATKDGGKQYIIQLNTVTYHILISNLINVGSKIGINIRQGDIDKASNEIQMQFDTLILSKTLNVPVTFICYHTKNKIQLQLLGRKNSNDWDKKLVFLQYFVNVKLVGMVKKIEELDNYDNIKGTIKSELVDNNAIPAIALNTSIDVTETDILGEPSLVSESNMFSIEDNDNKENTPIPTSQTPKSMVICTSMSLSNLEPDSELSVCENVNFSASRTSDNNVIECVDVCMENTECSKTISEEITCDDKINENNEIKEPLYEIGMINEIPEETCSKVFINDEDIQIPDACTSDLETVVVSNLQKSA